MAKLKKNWIDSIDLKYKNIDINKSKHVKYFKIHTYTVNSYSIIGYLYSHVDFIITDLDIVEKTDKYQFFNQRSNKVKFIN